MLVPTLSLFGAVPVRLLAFPTSLELCFFPFLPALPVRFFTGFAAQPVGLLPLDASPGGILLAAGALRICIAIVLLHSLTFVARVIGKPFGLVSFAVVGFCVDFVGSRLLRVHHVRPLLAGSTTC